MVDRDERPVGRVPAWVWAEAEEEPPYPPGYTMRELEVTEEEDRAARERFARSYNERFPDSPPLDPDKIELIHEDPETPDPEWLDDLHPAIPPERLRSRLPKWDADARELDPSVRPSHWAAKADALEHLFAEGYVGGSEFLDDGSDIVPELRRRESAARFHHQRLEAGRTEATSNPVGTDTPPSPSHGRPDKRSRFVKHYPELQRLYSELYDAGAPEAETLRAVQTTFGEKHAEEFKRLYGDEALAYPGLDTIRNVIKKRPSKAE